MLAVERRTEMFKSAKTPVKVCPECGGEFEKVVNEWRHKYQSRVPCCPSCKFEIYVSKNGKKHEVIPYERKYTVDNLIKVFLQTRAEVTGMDFTLGNVTGRERKFAYEMIDWAKRFMKGAEYDIGYTVYEFLEHLLRWILSNECAQGWWRQNMESLIQLRNSRQNLAYDYYALIARQRGIVTKRDERLKKNLHALKERFAT